MPISGRRISPAGIRPVRWFLIYLPMLVIPACALFHFTPPHEPEPPQLLTDPHLDEVVASGRESSGWRFEVDPATPGLRTGPMMIRRTRGLGISQEASRSDRGEVNALIQRIEDPPVGEWYRFYLEFAVEKASPDGVRIDLRFYNAADELILANGWSPEVTGTVPFHWGETVGQIPAECAWVEVVAGLNRSASGTFVLQEARFELHDPTIQTILTGESRFFNGGLHLVLKTSSEFSIVIDVDLESSIWHRPFVGISSIARYTLKGGSLDLKLDGNSRYRDENGYEFIGTRTWWIRGVFERQAPNSVGEGAVTGYLTLNGTRADSLRTRPLYQRRRPPPDDSPF